MLSKQKQTDVVTRCWSTSAAAAVGGEPEAGKGSAGVLNRNVSLFFLAFFHLSLIPYYSLSLRLATLTPEKGTEKEPALSRSGL